MRPVSTVTLLAALLVTPAGCRKAAPTSDLADASTPTATTNDDAMARLAADLRTNSPTRRSAAIDRAVALDAQGEDVIPTLLEALKDPTAGELGTTRAAVATSTREAAVMALVRLRAKGRKALTESGLKTLEDALKDPKSTVREHTANAIGMAGADATRSALALITLCSDAEPKVRAATYSALERIPSVPAEPTLKLLRHPDVSIAADAASALAWLKPTGPAAVPLLVEALKREPADKDDPAELSRIRNSAAEALGGIGKGAESAVPALVELVIKTKVEDVERMARPMKGSDTAAALSGAVQALRKIGSPAVPSVVPLLKHNEAVVRFQAAAILRGIGPAAAPAEPAVQIALEAERRLPTGQMYVFEELVAAALNMGGDPEAITAPVLALLASDEAGVRFGACQLIGRIGRRATAAVPRLTELLDDSVVEVRGAAADALGAIGRGSKAAVPALARRVEGDDTDQARTAARALRVIGPAAAPAAPALAKAIGSNDERLCIEAAEAISAIGPEAAGAAPALAKLLDNPETRRGEKLAFLDAVAAIAPPAKDALPALTRRLADKDGAVRMAAVRAIGKLSGDPATITKTLTDALKDPLQAVHVAALAALAGMGPSAAAAADDIKAVMSRTNNPAAKIWAAAALVALGVEHDAHLKAVLAAVKDRAPDKTVARVAAIDAVAVIGARAAAAVPDLKEALKDKSPVARGERTLVRERAAQSLGRLGGKIAGPAIPALVDLLRESDPAIRRAAVEALGSMGPDAVVAAPRLRDLTRTDPTTAEAAWDALEKIEVAPKLD